MARMKKGEKKKRPKAPALGTGGAERAKQSILRRRSRLDAIEAATANRKKKKKSKR